MEKVEISTKLFHKLRSFLEDVIGEYEDNNADVYHPELSERDKKYLMNKDYSEARTCRASELLEKVNQIKEEFGLNIEDAIEYKNWTIQYRGGVYEARTELLQEMFFSNGDLDILKQQLDEFKITDDELQTTD